MTEEQTVTEGKPHIVEWDALGNCTVCHLPEYACKRVNSLIATRQAVPYSTNTACGHVMIYRSTGKHRIQVPPKRPVIRFGPIKKEAQSRTKKQPELEEPT